MGTSEDIHPEIGLDNEISPAASDPGTHLDLDAVSKDESHDPRGEKLDNTHFVGEGDLRVEVNDEEHARGNLLIGGIEESVRKGYDIEEEEIENSSKEEEKKYEGGESGIGSLLNKIKSMKISPSFAHELLGLRGDDPRGSIKCKFYLSPGGCKYGDACRYSHSKEQSITTDQLNVLGLPLRPSAPECKYYMRNGFCGYGANCRFNHSDHPTENNKSTNEEEEIQVSLAACSILLSLMASARAKSQSSGDGAISTSNPEDKMRQLLYPFDTIKEQIGALNLSADEKVYLSKSVLLDGDSENFKSSFTGKFPELEARKAELDTLSRRLRGIVRSSFRYPTYRKLYQVVMKRMSKIVDGQSSSGSQ